ncbi:transcriptional regulator, DeoR family [Truepera radiovictrix DSM 17093]|uniref:Transcriptional regulator, DeoR family n=1 Tax=Truepera radiovictrix (strain DSM 17093 / CIP 108686 / LMG 22925 / RQ-24) TaxID=649638 RepID=D7CV91_TRURR|nr:DeoR/GlpR family DNA-binding transcription regulator [Truepera radiovictrix]ADI14119.1 transcriptional regulator, DeoR family [Truepera radiovictrix DSM 17093]WMT57320.1 DeoR/GlpR family DNA-binding transcription regulator [Truepera radiovictrix]
MLAAERHRVILDRLGEEGVITTAAIAQALGVSEMTIRRDLADLERRGLLRRVHGGAQAAPGAEIPPYGQRSRRQPAAKQQVGARAAALVRDGETLFLDAGTTCMEVARACKDRSLKGLHVLTHAVNIAAELAGQPGVTVIQLGGEVIGRTYAATGPMTVSAIEQFSFDRAFVSAQGVHPKFGLTCSSLLEVEIKRAVLRRSRYNALVVDSSKWSRQAMIRFAALGELQAVVSDAGLPEEARRSLEGAGVEVFVPP